MAADIVIVAAIILHTPSLELNWDTFDYPP